MDRASLRKQLRSNRQSLSAEQQLAAAKKLSSVVCSSEAFRHSQHIALYLANDGEIDPGFIAEVIWEQDKFCYLPVLDQKQPEKMYFQLYRPNTRMVENRYGIAEPELDLEKTVKAEALDLVLMPLTGFDEQGNRLGMGAGYYDRTFAFLENRSKPILMGLAHECQKVSSIPAADWDVPMKSIATEKQLYGEQVQ
ncbi:5-formyltetrahydrofolate cyclo-ligase [Endozoicomonas sp. 8E]|uniref:5-formyltetrahydrofolate cyclo-ligase n=1 Tax=Endozoicomonas sp. 8E TaxID=3035692 RepID=UPI00293911F3|nr:5-formyltetrahydrofolate cyclo-ligase [Endozoicomonas sp. 8E]WOG27441.1 5-formyltetrahydrofolate cyclo-ligase [Endozoicomonas sp. 8E]